MKNTMNNDETIKELRDTLQMLLRSHRELTFNANNSLTDTPIEEKADELLKRTQTDYSHLVGKFVKRIVEGSPIYTINKWYKVVVDEKYGIGIEGNLGGGSYCVATGDGTKEEMKTNFLAHFDLSNPLDHNPDDVRLLRHS